MSTLKDFLEKPVRRRRVYKGRSVDFWADTVRLPAGNLAIREYIGHPGAVAVVARLDGGPNPRLLFVRQYRYPVKEVTHEIPAGKLHKGENPRLCVQRELEEETGYRARRVRKLLSYWPTPAFADEVIHIFSASGLTKGRFNPDEDEIIEPVEKRLNDALGMIQRGKIRDSKTVIALLAFARWSRS